jgi:hypothetical protein
MDKNVFVSSRLNGELDEERAIVSRTITDMGLKPILWENETSTAEHNQKWWRQRIDESGVLVLLLGVTISPPVHDEVSTAIRLNKKLAIFCKDVNLVSEKKLVPQNWPIGTDCRPALDWLYSWLSQHRLNRIGSLDSFKIALRTAIADTLEFTQAIPHRYLVNQRELTRIQALYVRPQGFSQAKSILEQERLLFLFGPPHIGKTATALYILAGLVRSKVVRSVIACTSRNDLIQINSADVSDAGILLDDAFGKVLFDEEGVGTESQAILSLAEHNFVVITARTEVFKEALPYTRFGEIAIESSCVYLNQEGSYNERQLKHILENHLKFALGNGLIAQEQADIANRHKPMILKELRFPHNIERFATVHLGEVQKPGDLQAAVGQSKEVEKAAGQWYARLGNKQKAITIALAICGFEDWNQFDSCLKAIGRVMGMQKPLFPQDFTDLGGYITVSDMLAFGHPSYHTGVIREICVRHYPVIKSLLDKAKDSREGRILLGLSLREMAGTHHDVVLALAPALAMRPGKVRKHAIIALGKVDKAYSKDAVSLLRQIATKGGAVHRRRAARSLGSFADSEPKLVCEALLLLVDDPSHLVRLNIARVFSDKRSAFPDVAFAVLCRLLVDQNAKIRRQAVRGLEKLVWDFPDDAYRVLNNLPNHAATPKIRWFANRFCINYERMKGLTDEAAMRLERLKLDSHTYIQKRLHQIQ